MSSHVSTIVRSAIRVMESVHATHALCVAAGKIVVADAELNARFHSLKGSASEVRLLEELEQYEGVSQACEVACASFLANPETGARGLLVSFAAVEALLRAGTVQSLRPGEQPGREWRVLARGEMGDVTLSNQGVFDELVVDDWLHIEQLDDRVWWMRVGDARIVVSVELESAARVDIERGFYAEISGTTR